MLRSYVTTGLYTYTVLQYDIYMLLRRYYPLVKLIILGTTADNRSIYCLRVGNPRNGTILVNAGCHGREYANSMLVMHQLRRLLEIDSYRPLEKVQLLVIPMVNPDGVSISQFGIKAIHDSKLKNQVQSILEDCGESNKIWKSNARGIDINRNFSTSHWRSYDDGIYKPYSRYFKGYFPSSEIETYTLQNLCTSIKGIRAVVSYHSSGEEIYFDYGQSGNLLKDSISILNDLQSLTGYSKASASLNGVGFSDWVIETLKVPAFTIETGIGECPLSISEYPKIFKDNEYVLNKLLVSIHTQ